VRKKGEVDHDHDGWKLSGYVMTTAAASESYCDKQLQPHAAITQKHLLHSLRIGWCSVVIV